MPTTATDAYLQDTLKWQVPINQDSPVRLGWLDDAANTNNQPEQFTNWQTRSFAGSTVAPSLQAPDADADGDGIPNRQEYALCLNPLSSANEGRPKVGIITAEGQTFPGFIHQRRRNAIDLLYAVGMSDDLVAWDFGGTSLLQVGIPVIAPDGDSETVTFRLLPSGLSILKKFFSISITSPP